MCWEIRLSRYRNEGANTLKYINNYNIIMTKDVLHKATD